MSRPAPMPFFWEVLWPSRVAAATLAGVVAYAVYLSTVSTDGFEEALSMLFVMQLVLASTGYRDRLTRGHFDPLLAGRVRRVPIVMTHLL